jgi:lysophospholipase L1-like esterase
MPALGNSIARPVLFFGDSLVAGVGDSSGVGWVGRVTLASARRGVAVASYNLGVRGDTCEQVASRWRWEAVARLDVESGGRIVLSCGASDALAGVELDRSRAAVIGVLSTAAALGLPVLMVGPAPVRDLAANQRIRALSQAFAQVCAQASVPFIGVFDTVRRSRLWLEDLRCGDGVHPSGEGHQALADVVFSRGWSAWLRASETR